MQITSMSSLRLSKMQSHLVSLNAHTINNNNYNNNKPVGRSFVWPATSFDPSHVYANWYCGPLIKLKCAVLAHKL